MAALGYVGDDGPDRVGIVHLAADIRNLTILAGLRILEPLGLLSLFRQTSLFAEMRRNRLTAPKPATPPAKKVLFLSMKGTWRTHLAWEYVLAHALQLRGAQCTFLLNDNFFPKCDVRIHNNPSQTRAWVSSAYSRLFAKYLGLPRRWVSEFVSDAQAHELRNLAASAPMEELTSMHRGGIAVDAAIQPSLRRFFRRSAAPDTPYAEKVHREFLCSGLLAIEAFHRALEEIQPDAVITVNGKMYAENIMFQLCRERGIDVFTYERGKIKDTINFVRNQISVDWDNEYAWAAYANRDLTAGESKAIHDYVEDRKAGGNTVLHFNPNPEQNAELIKKTAGYTPGKKHFLMLTNIVWDSAVQNKDIAFESMFDWIRHTIEFFRGQPDANLILRIHPAEIKISSDLTMEKVADYLAAACPDLPENLTVIGPESDVAAYSLLEFTDAVLVYTSTIGLESAMEEIPTVVCGDTHYSHKGFTIDIAEKPQYNALLADLIASDSKPDMDWAAAWKYAYVFFFKCMLPFPYVSEDSIGHLGSRLPASLEELQEGREPNLDLVCNAILNGTQAVP